VVVDGRSALQCGLGLSLDPESAGGEALAEAMAAACRRKFGADYGLSVGPFPAFDPRSADPLPVHFGLAGPGGTRVKSAPFAAHPAILTAYCAKQALNLLRLSLGEG
jgi:nicotinamide mononucleotide (NMN) deamidase PncC